MPDDKHPPPADRTGLDAELRAGRRNARLRDQFGEWFKVFRPEPVNAPEPSTVPDRGVER